MIANIVKIMIQRGNRERLNGKHNERMRSSEKIQGTTMDTNSNTVAMKQNRGTGNK